MANLYDLGAEVRCAVAFTNSASVAHDPSSVYFQVVDANNSTTSYVYGGTGSNTKLIKSATGSYYVDVNANSEGAWWYSFWGTGTGQSADENWFRVAESRAGR